MSVSKQESTKTHIKLREACNDLICAVKENPHVFKHVELIHHPKPKPLPSSYRHLGIIALIGAALAKIGLH